MYPVGGYYAAEIKYHLPIARMATEWDEYISEYAQNCSMFPP